MSLPAIPPLLLQRPTTLKSNPSKSILQLRLKKFRSFKRGYYSLLILVAAYIFTFFLPLAMNNRAIAVRYNGAWYFPAFRSYVKDTFGFGSFNVVRAGELGQTEAGGYEIPSDAEARYRDLKRQYAADKALFESLSPLSKRKLAGDSLSDEEEKELQSAETALRTESPMTPLEQATEKKLTASALDNFVLMPTFDHSPYEEVEGLEIAPQLPSWKYPLGVDAVGRDVMTRLVYGFRVSITMALFVVSISYTVGTLTGTLLGYYGRWIDILGLRFVEVWGSIPFLYTVMILARIFQPNFYLLGGLLAAFGWMGITYYIRGEFYREKARDYVAAALATGEGDFAIICKHILPNALTPIIAFAPFAIVGTISALVALDFLGFGLPPKEPSWGQLLRQATESGLSNWHLIIFPLAAMFITLQLIVFVGEAVREAFDPKVFSRLR